MIKEVYPGSIAQEMEIEPGDILLSINHEVIEDVFDYRYLIKDEYIEVVIRKPDGEEWLLEIDKEYDDDLGVEFENGLMIQAILQIDDVDSLKKGDEFEIGSDVEIVTAPIAQDGEDELIGYKAVVLK